MDKDPELQCKSAVTFTNEKDMQIYPGGGKHPWVKSLHDGFRIYEDHECVQVETEFSESFELAQEDVERCQKNTGHKRTMHMWKNALGHVWKSMPIEETQQLIDRMPKIMEPILEAKGGIKVLNIDQNL